MKLLTRETDNVIQSKIVIIGILTLILANIKDLTGIDFPIPPETLYVGGIALIGIIRIFWTNGKITSFLPKRKPEIAEVKAP